MAKVLIAHSWRDLINQAHSSPSQSQYDSLSIIGHLGFSVFHLG
jgi:hypothetical protein